MSQKEVKKFAVLTSGGDSPAMNAAVYGFVCAANTKGYEVYGIIDGYKGFISGDFKKIDAVDFKKNLYLSGTAIGSSRCLEFKQQDVRMAATKQFLDKGFSGLFVIGGDGSYMGASFISELGCPVVTAPGTIDNDVSSSHYTIGFFSAVEEIFQSIKKIKATSESHSQVTFIEVMGRHCHDLSVVSAFAGGVDYVVTNESIKTKDELVIVIKEMINAGKRGIVILVTEKVYGLEHGFNLPDLKTLCTEIEKEVKRQVRFNVLGYTQRGAIPTSWDLYMSQNFGLKAFEAMDSNNYGVAIGFNGFDFYNTPLKEAVKLPKTSSNDVIEFINSRYKI